MVHPINCQLSIPDLYLLQTERTFFEGALISSEIVASLWLRGCGGGGVLTLRTNGCQERADVDGIYSHSTTINWFLGSRIWSCLTY